MPGIQTAAFIYYMPTRLMYAWGKRASAETPYRGVLGTHRSVDELVPRPNHSWLGPTGVWDRVVTSGSSAIWQGLNATGILTSGLNTSGERGIVGDNSDRNDVDPNVAPFGWQDGAGFVVDISAGGTGATLGTMFAIRNDGGSGNNVYATGRNTFGQMGMGDTTERDGLFLVWNSATYGADAVKVHAGGSHAMVLDSLGRVWTAGRNNFGQLGRGTIGVDDTTWGQVSISAAIDIACSHDSTLFLMVDGTPMACGDGNAHQLGQNVYAAASHQSVVPLAVDGLTFAFLINVVELMSHGPTSWFRLGDGRLYFYGTANSPSLVNQFGGPFGFGFADTFAQRIMLDWGPAPSSPYVPSSPQSVTCARLSYTSGTSSQGSSGNNYSVIGSDGRLYTWGSNAQALRGDGTSTLPTNSLIFESANGLANVTSATHGRAQQFAIADGLATIHHFPVGPTQDAKVFRRLAADALPTGWEQPGLDDSGWTTPVPITPDPTHLGGLITTQTYTAPTFWERDPDTGTNIQLLWRAHYAITAETNAFGNPGVFVRLAGGANGPTYGAGESLGRFYDAGSLMWVDGLQSISSDEPFATEIVPGTTQLYARQRASLPNLGPGTTDPTTWVQENLRVVYLSATAAPVVPASGSAGSHAWIIA